MFHWLKTFKDDQDGAVTVDWVVLTAAVVGLATAVYVNIESETRTLIGAAATAVGSQNDFGGGGGGGDEEVVEEEVVEE